jgi:hypothetical protein
VRRPSGGAAIDTTADDPRCPDADTLRRFLLGQLAEAEATALEGHLLHCPACCRNARTVRPDDPFVAALHGAGAVAVSAEGSVVEDLIGRLRPLHRPAALAVLGTAAGGDTAASAIAEVCDALAPPGEPDELGRFGPYGILRVLGSGGMGVVFAARQERPRRVVALKMLLAGPHAGRQRLARFLTETEVVGRLQHPHIVPVHEVGEHDGRPYFTMEYVDGGSLAQRLAAAPLAPRPAAELAEKLARAVQFAHERAFVHRDLKPANVLLATDGTPKVADFGLAKQLDTGPDDPGARTESGAILGTPGYMAPEQAEGKKDVGPAADVYALGAILYECLTGRPPFKAATVLETLEQVRSQEPVPISRLQPKVPRDLQTICLKCLEKAPARRYGSAQALADDLGRFLRGEPIRARPVSARERLVKWARRQPALAALLAVSGLSLAALIAGVLVHNARLRVAVKQANDSADEAHRQQRRADASYRAANDTLDRIRQHLQGPVTDSPQVRQLVRQLLEDQLAYYEGALGGADDPDPAVRLDTARAHERAAVLELFLSRNPDALRSLTRAIDPAGLNHNQGRLRKTAKACLPWLIMYGSWV